MKLTSGLRLVLSAFLLAASVGVLWWLVGFPLGKGFLGAGDPWFGKHFAFDESSAFRLVFLALVVAFTVEAVPAGTNKWLPLGAIAVAATLVEPDRGPASALAVVLLVFCAQGVSEMGTPLRELVAALVSGVLIALPTAFDAHVGAGPTAAAALLRGIFFFGPLLALMPFLERWVLKRVGV